MALSGSVTSNEYNSRSITVEWSATQNVANNQSTISWTLKGSGSATGWVKAGGFKVTINGTVVYSTSTDTRIDLYNNTVVSSGTTTITHNADGSKAFNISCEAGVYTYAVSVSASQNFTLNTIPRASTISATNATIGKATTITVNRASSGFTHWITAKFGNTTVDVTGKAVSNTSISFTIPTSFYSQIPNSKSGTCTLTCWTYSGNTQIGSTTTCTFTVSVDEANCKPTISCTNTYTDEWKTLTGSANKVIYGVGTVGITASATAKNSATIKSYSIKNGSSTVNSSSAAFNGVTDGNIYITVTDSRGISNTYTKTLTVVSYNKPSVAISDYRLTTDGTLTFKVKGTMSNINFGATTNAVELWYQIDSGAWQTLTVPTSGSTYNIAVTKTGLDYTKTYKIRGCIRDKVWYGKYDVYSNYIAVTCKPVFDWSNSDFNFNVPVTLPSVTTTKGNNLDTVKQWKALGSQYTTTSAVSLADIWANMNELQIVVNVGTSGNGAAWLPWVYNKVMGNGAFVTGLYYGTGYYSTIAFTVNTSNKTVQVNNSWWKIVYGGKDSGVLQYYIYYR